MKISTVDLYSEYNLERANGIDGRLTCMLCDDVLGGDKKRPSLLIVAGGGYDHVSKREQEPVAIKYLAEGYNCFILHYSVKVLYPTALIEASLAMNYIRKNADLLNVDKDKVYALGFSAGAHLCGTLALNYDEPIFLNALKDLLPRLAKSIISTAKPNRLLLCYPVITTDVRFCHKGSINMLSDGDNRLIDVLSLEKRVKNDTPSTFIWHTSNDGSVPVYNSLCFANALSEKGVPFALHIFENGKHGLSVANGEVYNADEMPNFSVGIKHWVKMSLDWLNDKK